MIREDRTVYSHEKKKKREDEKHFLSFLRCDLFYSQLQLKHRNFFFLRKGENPSQIFARTSIIETETHLSLTSISPVALVKRAFFYCLLQIDNSPSSVLEQNIQVLFLSFQVFLFFFSLATCIFLRWLSFLCVFIGWDAFA